MAKPLLSKKKELALQQLLGRAMDFHRMGRLPEAEQLYGQVLAERPRQFEAQHLLGVLRAQQGRLDEGLEFISAALRANPDSAVALSDCGLVLSKLGRHAEALARLDKAIALKPDHAAAFSNRGNVLAALARPDEALASFTRALQIRPDYAEALSNRGKILAELARYDEALASYDKALAVRPRDDESHYGRGNVLAALKRYEDALSAYDHALAARSDHVEALINRGNALLQLKRPVQALESYDRVLAIKPADAGALNNRGTALKDLKRYAEALDSFDRALAASPAFPDALYNRGNVLKDMKRYEDALVAYDQARAIKPDHPDACGLMDAALAVCDWQRVSALVVEVTAAIESGESYTPFALLGFCDDEALLRRCSENFITERNPVRPDPLFLGPVKPHERIRLAYLSADFQAHATAYLIAELFEKHDRSRFDVHAVSFGRDDGGAMRQRLIAGVDRFHDVRSMSDRDAARLVHDLEVDIAIDLKGYTLDCRPEILSHRPAPIQVNYLGYPGTMGTDFIDYVIADRIVLPLEHQPFYSEKIVHLPDCYQVNDGTRRIAQSMPARRDVGLPDDGFVFCCFNNNYKITQSIFDAWMRILRAVPQSVLWLLSDNAGAEANLRREAQARAVNAERLVFARRCNLEEHLARHRLADLFLDTLPYNAHTTASDALWAGVPLLTCLGKAFAGRVAASLLDSIGLPELVAPSLDAYEAMAVQLAKDQSMLDGLRARLQQNRRTHTLFDAKRFCRGIEAAYVTMWDISRHGKSPRSFAVGP